MRILSTESLVDTIVRYSEEPNSLGLIVLRNGERRRNLYHVLNSIIFSEEVKPIRHGCVLSFRNHSMIHILIAANRPTRIYDDVLVDDTIDDIELLCRLEQLEWSFAISDFGEIDPSPEILEYIRGEYGTA